MSHSDKSGIEYSNGTTSSSSSPNKFIKVKLASSPFPYKSSKTQDTKTNQESEESNGQASKG